VHEAAAKSALENLRREFGKKAPGMIAAWERAWDELVPFLKYDASTRKVIYTSLRSHRAVRCPPQGVCRTQPASAPDRCFP
jgi:transposase-like protein